MRKTLTILIAAGLLAWAGAQLWPTAAQNGGASAADVGPSGLPLPRFVSLKSNRVNVRKGPSLEHPVAWEFKRVGLPVEVINEFEHWRQVRDSEGAEGWVFHALLSGRRTALVMPWAEEEATVPLYSDRSDSSAVVAQLEPGVLGNVVSCDGSWCNLSLDSVSGWIEQVKLWGVYENEKIDE